MKRVGIDVGGTFTDVVLLDDAADRVWATKVPTTPRDPVVGTVEGFRRILDVAGARSSEIGFLGHGTTMATNMVVEGKGARTALVTTGGFRDILELRRVSRHDRADLYDLFFDNPPPLVPRRWRLEVAERIRFDSAVETPLDLAEVRALAAALESSDIEAVAVVFLHAHINPTHEIAAADELRRLLPDRFVCASHEVNPEIMEYERTTSTVVNAMLGPVCGRYISRLTKSLAELGFSGEFLFMQSNGGLASPPAVAERPITILESGPAGGVSAAIRCCEKAAVPNAILGDMGGTTFDVSLVRGSRAELRNKSMIHSHPVRSPTIDIDSVGAGGGSIAWLDAGGGLRIGPRSAGADPGPACYGRGGDQATITDCNLVLGYIDPKKFLGGLHELDLEAARRVVEQQLAKPLGVGLEQAAQMVRSVANALMAQAVRIMTVERGHDPREFSYLCYGGAGPLHALDIAEEIGIRRIVIPPLPGLFSAFGVAIADQQYDFQLAVDFNLESLGDDELAAELRRLDERAASGMQKAAVDYKSAQIIRRADCRYAGQPDVITIDLPPATRHMAAAIRREFEATHARQWNFTSAGKAVLVSNVRLQIVIASGWRGSVGTASDTSSAPVPDGTRSVFLDDCRRTLPVFRRSAIAPGTRIGGPAVVEEDSTCIVLKPAYAAFVDDDLNLLIELA